MRTLRFSINVKAIDCYIYGGYLFLALEDGKFGYVPMSRIMHQLKGKYPEFQSLLRMAFERNDFFSNETGKTYLGIKEVMLTLIKLWEFASESIEFCLDFEDIENDFYLIDIVHSFPILDIKMYAMTLFVGCKDGLFESRLNLGNDNYSIEPAKFRKKFDAKIVGLNAYCGSIVVSTGNDGMFFGPFDLNTGVNMDEKPVDAVSYRTSWSSTDIVNYKSSSDFDYLVNKVEKFEDKPNFSKFDERSERKRIVKLCEKKYDMNNLFQAGQLVLDDVIYAFNSSSSSFVLTKKGFYNMNFVKTGDDIHLSSKVNELSLFDKKRKFEKPISASVIPAGCVIEFFDKVVVVRGNKVLDIESEPVYSVRSYMASFRYRNLVSITKQNSVSIHSLDPFETYSFIPEKGINLFRGNERYAFKNVEQEELPF